MQSKQHGARRRVCPPSLSLLCLAATMALFAVTGCAEHHYRVYDPYYSDYHVWNNNEVVYYHRWANENHRDPNRDFRKLPPGEQKEYWTWRHSHS
jgi:hypothetical protein